MIDQGTIDQAAQIAVEHMYDSSGKVTVHDVKRMRDDAQARRDALNRCVAELDLIIHAAERVTR